MQRAYALVAILTILSYGAASAEDRWSCHTRDGIVNDIALAEPYLWCATGGGVVRWDTRDGSWIRYTCADGLPVGAYWRNIACDGDGCIWVFATRPTMVMMFDGTAWRAPEETDWRAKVRFPMVSDGKGGTWAYHEGSGVVWFKGDTYKIHTPADGLSGSVVTALAIDRNNAVCVGTTKGLSHFNGVEWTSCSGASAPPGTDVRSIAIDTENAAWVVTDKGVFSIRGTEWVTRILDGGFQQMVVGSDGVKWFATSAGGLTRYDGVTWTSYTTDNSGIPDNYIKKFTIDNTGVIWLSCSRSIANSAGFGLTRFNGYTWANWNTDGPIENISYSAAVDHDNVKWFGTDIGVSRYDGVKWTNYQRVDGRAISGGHAIIVDKSNRKWFMGPGVISFNGAEWTFHTSDDTPPQMLDMTSYTADRNGVEWIGTNKTGLWRRDGGGWKNYNASDGLPGGGVRALTVDMGNRVWVGTDQGLAVVDGETLTRCAGGPDSLVTAIAVDSRYVKWIGTSKLGIWRYDGSTWRNFTRENSALADNYIRSVAVDRDDVKWCVVSGFNRLQRLSGPDMENGGDFGIDPGQVEAIIVDSDNVKWFSTWGGGVMSLRTIPTPSTGVSFAAPSRFLIGGAFPNPFNASTLIRFSLERGASTEIVIYNSAGQIVRKFAGEILPPGEHIVRWDGYDDRGARAASGAYIARILANRQAGSVKMMLLK